MGKIIRNTLILTIITVVAGLGLDWFTKLPKNPLQEPRNRQKKKHGRLYSVM